MNEDGKTVRAMDVLFPKIGEIIGGSERESDYDKLMASIKERNIPMKDMWWYLDTRKIRQLPSFRLRLRIRTSYTFRYRYGKYS
jgi:asparaginyl-tRNA synthetase